MRSHGQCKDSLIFRHDVNGTLYFKKKRAEVINRDYMQSRRRIERKTTDENDEDDDVMIQLNRMIMRMMMMMITI